MNGLTHIESTPLPATLELRKTRSRKGAAAMKNQAIQYLAFDVHQATTVATVRDERGAIKLRATVPTEAKAIVALVRGLGGRVHVAFEEGTPGSVDARSVGAVWGAGDRVQCARP